MIPNDVQVVKSIFGIRSQPTENWSAILFIWFDESEELMMNKLTMKTRIGSENILVFKADVSSVLSKIQ